MPTYINVNELMRGPRISRMKGLRVEWCGQSSPLTLEERIMLRFGKTDAEALAAKRWPDLVQARIDAIAGRAVGLDAEPKEGGR